jgi:hypothetical protein
MVSNGSYFFVVVICGDVENYFELHSYPAVDMNAVQNSFPHHHKSQQQKNNSHLKPV